MSRTLMLSALLLSAASAWGQGYGLPLRDAPRPFGYVFSEDLARRGVAGLNRPAGPIDGPWGPVMHGRELPTETVSWLRSLGPDDVAILCVIHGPGGLAFPQFPIEELAALVNECEAGFLMVVLDLPAQYKLPALDEILRERRRTELFQRHTIVLAAKAWGVRHWVTAPSSEEFPEWFVRDPQDAAEHFGQGLPLFSAYLYQALQGHADRDLDRKVTAQEAFEYAFWCTWIDCDAPGAKQTQTVRQTPSARPGPGWATTALTAGGLTWGPDPLAIVKARYIARDVLHPLGPVGPSGPAGPRGPDTLPAGPWPQELAETGRWTWGNIAAIEERLAAVEERFAQVRVLAEDPPGRLDVPRWREGEPVLGGDAAVGPAGWPGPASIPGREDQAGLIGLVSGLLGGSVTGQQLALAQGNERTLFDLARALRDAEYEVKRLAVICADYYAIEALSISPQFIAPTQWPEGLPAPFALRGPTGPVGPWDGPGTIGEPERVEPLWAEATTQRLRGLSERVRVVSEQAEAATRAFNEATGGWGGLER